MWSTNIFVTEMLGMFLLVAAVIAAIVTPHKLKMTGAPRLALSMAMVFIGLFGAVMAGQLSGGKGWVNPAVALMSSIGSNNYDQLLPALVGEVAGAIGAAIMYLSTLWMLSKLRNKEAKEFDHLVTAFPTEKKSRFIIDGFEEILASIAFFVVVMGVTLSGLGKENGVLNALAVGAGGLLGIIVTTESPAMLNGGAGLSIFLIRTGTNKMKGGVTNLINYGYRLFVELGVAAAMGGIWFAVN